MNIIDFAADTTNIMFGQHNSVLSRFKYFRSSLHLPQCALVCVSCMREAPLHSRWNYFCHSAKRQAEFENFQIFADPQNLETMPNSMAFITFMCASSIRTVGCTNPLFQICGQFWSSQKILTNLENPIWRLYFHFLNFVLPKFTELNPEFKNVSALFSSRPGYHIYRDILSCYMMEGYWRQKDLKDKTQYPK